MPEAPCRLFVYLAREAPLAVVLRRGPSDWARLSLWHTDNDTFEHGQWIKGRAYERRSDLSPDGRLFAAFVRQSGGRGEHPNAADTWVAVSRPPYFTALAVWFVGGTYYTGGFFPDNSTFWPGFTDEAPDIGRLPPWLNIAAPGDVPYIDGSNEWPERTVHFNRLLRDGWRLIDKQPYVTTWERDHPREPLTLTMKHAFEDFANYGGPYAVEYAMRDRAAGAEYDIGQATWADWDQKGRLVLTRDGRIYDWQPEQSSAELADFNDQRPEPEPAPDWAREWPPDRSSPSR